jgi:hypothetical protein
MREDEWGKCFYKKLRTTLPRRRSVFNVIQVYAKAGMNSEALQFMNAALGYI